jgi:flagellar basal body-associated protein FliL
MVPVTIGLGGSFLSPSPKLMMDEQKQQVKDAATAAVKEETKKQADKLIGNLLGKPKADSTKTDSTKTAPENTTDKLKKEATDKIQNLLKKKKKS